MSNFAKSRNFYLLLLLIVGFFSNALLPSCHFNLYLVNGGIAFTVLLCMSMISQSRAVKFILIPLATLVIYFYILLYLLEPSINLYTLHFTTNAIFLVAVTIVQIRAVAMQEEITLNTLLGAICGYLMIGLTWSYFYLATAHLSPGSFFPTPPNITFRINLDYFSYFSFTTLTTLGYGDIVPRSNFARTLAWMETATGQIYLAVWISQLVAIRIAQRIKKNKI